MSNSSQNVPALKIASPPRKVGLDRRAVRHLSGGLVRLGLIGAVRCVMSEASSPQIVSALPEVRLEFLDFLKMILPRGYILAGLFSHPFAKSPAHPRRRDG